MPMLSGIDIVIHLAARVHVMRETEIDPLKAFRHANVETTLNLARQAIVAGVQRFIYFSTVKVLGECGSFSDDTLPAPSDPYAASKLEAEEGLVRISRDTKMDTVIIRPPLVYGPGVRGNFLSLVQNVARGIPLPLGCVSGRRSLIGLGNLVDFTLHCARDHRAANRRFLVADSESLTVPDLIRRLAFHLGVGPRIVPCPIWLLRSIGSLLGRTSTISRLTDNLTVDATAARDLGWLPSRSCDCELKDLVAWFRKGRIQPAT